MSQPVSRHTYMFPAEIWLSIGSYLVNKPFELESGNRVEVLSGPLRTCSVETESRRDHIVQEMKRNQATLHNLSLSCTNIARAIQELCQYFGSEMRYSNASRDTHFICENYLWTRAPKLTFELQYTKVFLLPTMMP